jgi:MOSC domain-containing protein YiiM
MYPGPMSGSVEAIHIAAVESELPHAVDEVEVTADGVVGDRYSQARDLTLIEAEALEGLRDDTGIELSHEASRRNVLTRGIDLNALVGRRFRVGEAECVGRRLCEPCAHLQRLTHARILRDLVHRGGLRADILGGGAIRVGDPVIRV